MKHPRLFSLLAAGLLASISAHVAQAATLYQWTDAQGVLTYSPTPPPEGSDFKVKKIETGKRTDRQTMSPSSATANPESASQAEISETRIVPSPLLISPSISTNSDKVKASAPETGPDSATSIRLQNDSNFGDRCQDLANRITALESRVGIVATADDLNKTMLLLARYQKSYDASCANKAR
jgi:hypothetical protein